MDDISSTLNNAIILTWAIVFDDRDVVSRFIDQKYVSDYFCHPTRTITYVEYLAMLKADLQPGNGDSTPDSIRSIVRLAIMMHRYEIIKMFVQSYGPSILELDAIVSHHILLNSVYDTLSREQQQYIVHYTPLDLFDQIYQTLDRTQYMESESDLSMIYRQYKIRDRSDKWLYEEIQGWVWQRTLVHVRTSVFKAIHKHEPINLATICSFTLFATIAALLDNFEFFTQTVNMSQDREAIQVFGRRQYYMYIFEHGVCPKDATIDQRREYFDETGIVLFKHFNQPKGRMLMYDGLIYYLIPHGYFDENVSDPLTKALRSQYLSFRTEFEEINLLDDFAAWSTALQILELPQYNYA